MGCADYGRPRDLSGTSSWNGPRFVVSWPCTARSSEPCLVLFEGLSSGHVFVWLVTTQTFVWRRADHVAWQNVELFQRSSFFAGGTSWNPVTSNGLLCSIGRGFPRLFLEAVWKASKEVIPPQMDQTLSFKLRPWGWPQNSTTLWWLFVQNSLAIVCQHQFIVSIVKTVVSFHLLFCQLKLIYKWGFPKSVNDVLGWWGVVWIDRLSFHLKKELLYFWLRHASFFATGACSICINKTVQFDLIWDTMTRGKLFREEIKTGQKPVNRAKTG